MILRKDQTGEEKRVVLELFKCHFTAKEVAETSEFSYPTIRSWYNSFRKAKVKKYNRMNLISEDVHDHAQCNS